MTREMNKPDWHREWYTQNTVQEIQKMMCKCERKPVLDDWIKPFFDNCCRMEKIER